MNIGRWKISSKILLLGIVVFGTLLRLYFDVGIIGSGDFPHITHSYKIARGNFSLTLDDPQTAARIGFVYPVAFFYRVLGISEFSAYLYSLIISIASIILIYHLGKLFFKKEVGIMAAFLLSFFPLNVNYATQAFPDLAQAFFTGLAVYFFFLGEKKERPSSQAVLYFLTGITAGLSVLTKESGIIIFFFLGVFVLYKFIFRKEKLRWSYAWIMAGFLMIIPLQTAHDYIVSGDPLLRYHMIDRVYYSAVENLYNYSGYKQIERLFFHIPFLLLTNVNFGFFMVFLLMALMYSIQFRKKETLEVMMWLITLLLYLNFGSTSLTSYVPLPAGTPHYLEMLTFPSLMLIAFFVSQEESIIKRGIGPFSIFFLLITSIGFIYINPDRHIVDPERQLSEFLQTLGNKPMYTDSGTEPLISFLIGYKKDIRSYWKANYPNTGSKELIDAEKIKDAYVIVNKHFFNKIPKNYKVTFPKIYHNVPENWTLIKLIANEEGDLLVYYVP